MDITSFVQGMYWHDVAKPLYLGNDKHARLGYLLLEAAGKPQEALVALAHVSFTYKRPEKQFVCVLAEHLADYLQRGDTADQLSPLLALEHVLDRLAASTYTFMADELPNPKYHSLLNPFSRLPVTTAAFEGKPFIANPSQKAKDIPVLAEVFRDRLALTLTVTGMPQDGLPEAIEQAGIRSNKYQSGGDDLHPMPRIESAFRQALLLRMLQEFGEEFPERTYPPVNDTGLASHTRLTAVLAFVVARNLQDKQSGFLDLEIWLDGDTVKIGNEKLQAFIDKKEPSPKPWSEADEVVRDHLGGNLLRIAFDAHRDLYQSAVRLDDLCGTRSLAGRVRQAFKKRLAAALDAPELSEVLWLSETLFELVYFLPECLTAEVLARRIEETFNLACEDLVDAPYDGLLALLQKDFPCENPLDFTTRRSELVAQLQTLRPRYSLVPLPRAVAEGTNYDDFAGSYGRRLMEAYKKSELALALPRSAIEAAAAYLHDLEGDDIAGVCAVCDTQPVDVAFFARLTSPDPRDAIFRHATHFFRDQPQPLCISCIARRVLSHGKRQVPALNDMLRLDPQGDRVWAVELPAGEGPRLPPALLRSTACAADDFVNMGAAYIRRRKENSAELEVFPTVSYAADADSNVALISLAPTSAIYASYNYKGLLDALDKTNSDGNLAHQYLSYLVVDFYKKVRDDERKGGADLARATLVAEPHIARVLQRIKHVDSFFGKLQDILTAAGIRALPLDWEYPHLRLLVPGDQLQDALAVLSNAVSQQLFSFPAAKPVNGAQTIQQPDHDVMRELLPALLKGAVVVFKQKQALYLVLEAERELLQQKGPRNWRGFTLQFADMRGTLSAAVDPHTCVSYTDLAAVLALAEKVDRRTVLGAAITSGRPELEEATAHQMAAAQLYVRNDWARLDKESVKQLATARFFAPVHFIKTVTKR